MHKKLAAIGGGQLAATNTTITGQWKQLKNGTNDLLAAFGSLLAGTGALQGGLYILSTTMNYWAEALVKVFPQTAKVTNSTRNLSKEILEAKAATDQYVKAQKEIIRQSELIIASYDAQITKIKALNQAKDTIDNADMARELETIDARVSLAKLRPVSGRKKQQMERELAIVDMRERGGKLSAIDAQMQRIGVRDKYGAITEDDATILKIQAKDRYAQTKFDREQNQARQVAGFESQKYQKQAEMVDTLAKDEEELKARLKVATYQDNLKKIQQTLQQEIDENTPKMIGMHDSFGKRYGEVLEDTDTMRNRRELAAKRLAEIEPQMIQGPYQSQTALEDLIAANKEELKTKRGDLEKMTPGHLASMQEFGAKYNADKYARTQQSETVKIQVMEQMLKSAQDDNVALQKIRNELQSYNKGNITLLGGIVNDLKNSTNKINAMGRDFDKKISVGESQLRITRGLY
jgi:hypothetical protein